VAIRIKITSRPPDEDMEALPDAVRKYIESNEAAIKQLMDLVEKLGEKIQKVERESKRQATPFRRDDKKKKKKRKKPGRKGGHSQQRRNVPEHIDETCTAEHPHTCPCGGTVHTQDSYEQIQEDIETFVIVRQFIVKIGQCEMCGKTFEGRHPIQTSEARGNANHHIGPKALAIAAHLHFGQGVPFDKVREHLAHLGLNVSTATLVRAMERIANRCETTFWLLMKRVLEQDVLHIDETGWSIDGAPCYLWVISGSEATIYFVRKTRSSDEVADFLADFSGVLVTDGAKAYDKLGKKLLRALCLLHLKRNAKSLLQQQTGGAVIFPRALIKWLAKAIELVGQREKITPEKYQRRVRRLENKFAKILKTQAINPQNAKMIERLRTWQDAILRCLRDSRVPATNNHGEHQIRPGVVIRKRGGCNRSEKGARNFEIITSILVSCRQMKIDFVEWLVNKLRQPYARAASPFW
jgi:transposase